METLAAAIEASQLVTALRQSRWTYPAVNAAHVLGIALLVGSIVPMDLRLIGLWRRQMALRSVLALLAPVAASGAALAICTGALLFAVQATDYVATPIFFAKMGLVAFGLAHALALTRGLAGRPLMRQRLAGAVSLATWIAALVCGRMIGYL